MVLAASSGDVELRYAAGKATCIEWMPTKGHDKMAVGFADGKQPSLLL